MAIKKSNPIKYKRGKVEIEGDPKDIKLPIWFDLISARVIILFLLVILILLLCKSENIEISLRWIKYVFPFLMLVLYTGLSFLSG